MNATKAQMELVHIIEDNIGKWPMDQKIDTVWWFIRTYLPEARRDEKNYLRVCSASITRCPSKSGSPARTF